MSDETYSKIYKNKFLKITDTINKRSTQKASEKNKEVINLHNRKNKIHICQRWNLESVTSNSMMKQKID